MQEPPPNSLVVIEDIDSLFSSNREKKAKKWLTFSGLLNVLNSVGSSDGQLVFVTTNCREQINVALVRNGPLDVHVTVGPATKKQCRTYFERFYGPSQKTKAGRGEMTEEKKLDKLWEEDKKAKNPDKEAEEMDDISEELKTLLDFLPSRSRNRFQMVAAVGFGAVMAMILL